MTQSPELLESAVSGDAGITPIEDKPTRRLRRRLKAGRKRDNARLSVFAHNLNKGETTGVAGVNAGYSKGYMKRYGYLLAKSDEVVQLRMELAGRIKPGQLGGMAKTLLLEDLVKPPKEPGARNKVVRTALEVDGMIGGPNELHLHQHGQLPKVVEDMLLSKVKEILAGGTVDGEIIESRKDDEGVQVGDATFGFQDRAIG